MKKRTFEDIKDELIKKNVSYHASVDMKRIIAHTEEGIAIITEDSYLEIPLEELDEFGAQIKIAIIGCVEEFKKLSTGKKTKMARERGMTYGKLQAIVTLLDEEVE